MKKIKEKLHNNRGVSFLFALLAFMVAAMVSVTIITAAVSSIKRVYNDREEQQAHLTLTSAAQLIRDEMLDTTVKEVVTIKNSGNSEENKTTETTSTGAFGVDMQDAVKYVDINDLTYSSGSKFIKIEADSLNMDGVKATFTMQADAAEKYKVIFTLTLENSEETIYLTMTGSPGQTTTSTSTDQGVQTTTNTTEIKWNNPIIGGLGV
ncbi:MAG: hypothetical protein ACI4TF_10630 [Oliverpabstia sp.]